MPGFNPAILYCYCWFFEKLRFKFLQTASGLAYLAGCSSRPYANLFFLNKCTTNNPTKTTITVGTINKLLVSLRCAFAPIICISPLSAFHLLEILARGYSATMYAALSAFLHPLAGSALTGTETCLHRVKIVVDRLQNLYRFDVEITSLQDALSVRRHPADLLRDHFVDANY